MANINPGLDGSGNGNNWAPVNINFYTSSSTTYDVMTDVPTNTSATTANYCVWSPINKSSSQTPADGNLNLSSSSYGAICATMGVSSGKWYWEMLYTNRTSSVSPVIGFGNDLFNYTNPPGGYLGSDANAGGLQVNNGSAAFNGGSTAYGSAISTNDLVMFAMDLDNRKFYIGKNGTWFNSGDPVAGTNSWPYSANILGSTFFPAVNMYNDSCATNFGQRSFTYTPPTGFVALNTYNLPTPTIGATASSQANKYFDISLYTGNGGTNSITNSNSMQPDFVWTKGRGYVWDNNLFDAVRGATKILISNATNAESTNANSLTAFNSNGFTLGSESGVNNNGSTYVGWQWNAGGSNATNTNGSITSTVRANTTAGFSIVTYTGTGSAATVGHGLGVAPKMVIVKNRVQGTYGNWTVWHTALSGSQYLELNTYNGPSTNNNRWNGTVPTSTVFSVGTDSFGNTNKNGDTYVAYCFSEVSGYSKISSYTANGSAEGPFIYCGFRPKFILWKNIGPDPNSWLIEDASRSPYNAANQILQPDVSDAEASPTSCNVDFLSNGFKIRGTSAAINQLPYTILFMAFAESPFKYANAR